MLGVPRIMYAAGANHKISESRLSPSIVCNNRPLLLRALHSLLQDLENIASIVRRHRDRPLPAQRLREDAVVLNICRRCDGGVCLANRRGLLILNSGESAVIRLGLNTELLVARTNAVESELVFLGIEVELYGMSICLHMRCRAGSTHLLEASLRSSHPIPQLLLLGTHNSRLHSDQHLLVV